MRKMLANIPPDQAGPSSAAEAAADILLVDNDDMLAAGAADLGLPALAMRTVATAAEAELATRRGFDAVIVSLDLDGGLAAVEQLCRREERVPVIAIGGRSRDGVSLEHRLTLAELRGAALSLPKPIDASELALAAVRLIARRKHDARLGELERELEKLALY